MQGAHLTGRSRFRPSTLDKALRLVVNLPVPEYRHNKAKTLLEIVRRIENWPTAVGMRLFPQREGLRLLSFRDGLNVACRAGSQDWYVIHELLFAGAYERSLELIRGAPGPVTALDLGGNIGLFSLLAVQQRADVVVHAFEPGPPNYRLFEMNLLANPKTSGRIHLHREAVGPANATTNWFYDEQNPGGSGFFAAGKNSFSVTVRSFAEVVASLGNVAVAKIDIEGAEFDLIRGTPAATWENVAAIDLEVHPDPLGQMTQNQLFERMQAVGYVVEEQSICSYFLHR